MIKKIVTLVLGLFCATSLFADVGDGIVVVEPQDALLAGYTSADADAILDEIVNGGDIPHVSPQIEEPKKTTLTYWIVGGVVFVLASSAFVWNKDFIVSLIKKMFNRTPTTRPSLIEKISDPVIPNPLPVTADEAFLSATDKSAYQSDRSISNLEKSAAQKNKSADQAAEPSSQSDS